ncbi:hypothetical protein POSPLADRAFT_1079023, partial [Postia placenta MAD-698-R-SB12]
PETPTQPCKRRHGENVLPHDSSSKKGKYTPRRSDAEKLEYMFHKLSNKVRWTFPEFLYHTLSFRLSRPRSHAQYIQYFLRGRDKYTFAMILDLALHHPDGRVQKDSNESHLMYS